MDKRIKLNRRHTSQPVDISREKIDSILKDIERGSTRFHASEANEIVYQTFYYWVKQGQFDMQHGVSSLESYLVKALRNIEQNEIIKCRSGIIDSEKGHTGKQWTLEKVYWQHFGGNAPIIELAEEMRLEKEQLKEKIKDESESQESSQRCEEDICDACDEESTADEEDVKSKK